MHDSPVRRGLEAEDTRLDVMRYVRVVWRRRLLVILPVLFLTSITAVAVRFMSPLYVSRARLLIEQRTRVNSELERRIVDEDKRVRRKDRLMEVRMQVTNRDFLEGVIRELGLQNDPLILARAKILHDTRNPDVPTEEIALRMLVRGLRDKLTVKVAEDNMFTITVSDNDPESAYILAKVIARDFVTEVKRERMEKLEELFKFSSQQQRIYRDKVAEAERELRDFQSKLIRDQASGSAVNVTNVATAKGELRRLQLNVEQGQHRVDTLRELLKQVFDPLPDLKPLRADREVAALERRLRTGIEEESMTDLLRAAGSAPTFDVNGGTRNALRRRLAELADARFQSADEFYRDRIAEYAYEMVATDAMRGAAAGLGRQIDRYASRAEAQPELELQLAALTDRVTQARSDLETFERTVQSAQLSETILATELAGGVSIADPPEKPVAPVKPNKRRMVLLALALALVGGLGSIFALEYIDKSFKDIEEIQRVLNLHVIGTVPRVPGGLPFGGIPANRRQHLVLASSVGLLVIVLSGMALYERLLRKQHVTVPRARAEEILRGATTTSPAPIGPR
jgi:uncharacterized protein involved in exopolysaccharide biosynthesis